MRRIACSMICAVLTACAVNEGKSSAHVSRTGEPVAQVGQAATDAAGPVGDPYPSTYRVPAGVPTLIQHATVLTGAGSRLEDADVLIVAGKIQAVGAHVQAPPASRVIDGKGRWLTPGLIDVHSHLGLGMYPLPSSEDANEISSPYTAQVWAEHAVWPQDPGFRTALAGGVTTLQILPGSANLFSGRSVVLKNVPSATYQGMKFPGAPQGLKMACGANPKQVYGSRGQFPATRMGNVAGYREQWIAAQQYLSDQQEYQKKRAAGDATAKPPRRDLRLETLAGALRGEILVHMHCYRAEEMATILDLSREFGYHVVAFHHAVEAYKIADLLAEHGVCAAMWADWWGFKTEAYDGIPENIAFVDAARGGCAIVHSDSEDTIQRLNQEAGKEIAYAHRAGIDIPPEHAIQWVTANPAKALGLLDRIGTLEPGKSGDVVIWNGNPFSVYTVADYVFIDGALRYDRADPTVAPQSDFLLGQPATVGVYP